MKHNYFDKSQNLIRQKKTLHTLVLTFALLIINGIIKESYIWAVPMIEATVLILIPTLYFLTMCIFNNAYFTLKERNDNSRIIIFGIVALINIIVVIKSFISNSLIIIENGKLANSSFFCFSAVLFSYIIIISMIKKYLDSIKKSNDKN